MKILVCGLGYVGKQMIKMLEYAGIKNIEAYDTKYHHDEKLADYADTIKNNNEYYDFCFVCVPTPSTYTGSCDTSQVWETIKNFNAGIYVVKSTVSVGTCNKITSTLYKRVVFFPEFCGESAYDNSYAFHTDNIKTPWLILGGDSASIDEVYNLLLPAVGPEKKWFFLSTNEAEMVKYMENCFFATKIIFCNEMYDICESFDIDFKHVREAWLADPRINSMHTAVFKNKRGFNGKCLPKDLNALIATTLDNGISPMLLMAVKTINEKRYQN